MENTNTNYREYLVEFYHSNAEQYAGGEPHGTITAGSEFTVADSENLAIELIMDYLAEQIKNFNYDVDVDVDYNAGTVTVKNEDGDVTDQYHTFEIDDKYFYDGKIYVTKFENGRTNRGVFASMNSAVELSKSISGGSKFTIEVCEIDDNYFEN